MAASTTLADMRLEVRRRCDAENQTDWLDDAELDARINGRLRRLYGKLVAARGHEYYSSDATITLVNGTASYALPTNFWQLSSVTAKDGTLYCDLAPWTNQQRAELLTREASGGIDLSEYRYRLRASNIEVRPKPTATTHTLELVYVPTMPKLVLAADTFDGINGFEQWAELGVAIDVLAEREEADVSQLRGELGEIETDIQRLADARDAGHPERVQDVRHDWGYPVRYVPREPRA